ncbi:MarR family winged helix-turn-helix transcriptional regulator [Actinokineospora pegani]|uniref:MarR family winged helix-turn-helix transcriptional regulator n=1 Tax=Actinokineospora pegani TaxID=2654637 RepID=UPI0012E9BC2D|nr:MarR family winged helix-turn-helix transcriptional regulator [Actinokineospora pegani]
MVATTTASELLESLRAVLRAGRAVRQARADDLHTAPAALLGVLDRGGAQRMGRLAEHLDVDPSVVSRQVAALIQAGMVSRRPDPDDGRASLLELTPTGADCLVRHRDRWAAWLDRVVADWAEADVTALAGLLNRLSDDVRAHLCAPENEKEEVLDHVR